MNTQGVLALKNKLAAIWPLGPIFDKELRQMARRRRSYALRFCYLGLLLFVLSVGWSGMSNSYSYYNGSEGLVAQAQRQAQMGRFFFVIFAMFSITAMHLIGPVLTSTAIGSERLRRTLDALLMTPISAWQIVTGKLFSRLLTALVLIGLSLPVLAIVRLLGGVELDDMFGVLLLSACVALSSAAMGLLLSCWIKRAWAVILLSYLIQAAIYAIIPVIFMIMVSSLMRSSSVRGGWWLFELLGATNPLLCATAKLSGGTRMFPTSWTECCIVQVVFACVLTWLSSMVVRRVGRKHVGDGAVTDTSLAPKANIIAAPPPLPNTATPATPLPTTFAYAGRRERKSMTDHPVLWRELRQPLLRRAWQRTTLIVIVLGLLFLSYLALSMETRALQDDDVHIGYAFIMHTLLALIAIVISATAIATEKESDTWTLLIVSPISGRSVVLGKFAGVLRRLFWPLMLILLHFAIFTLCGIISFWSTVLVLWVAITFNLPWIATGIYLSLRVTKVTTAVVLNLLLVLAVYAVTPIVMVTANMSRSSRGEFDWSEACLYWLPYWFLGEGVSRLSKRDLFTGTVHMPVFNEPWPLIYILWVVLLAGLVQITVSAVILLYTSSRFDSMVGRAKTGYVATQLKPE